MTQKIIIGGKPKNMTTKTLKQLTSKIKTGLVIRRHKQPKSNQNYKLLTLKSVNMSNINMKEFDTITTKDKIDQSYLLQKNDIVMKIAKPYTAAIVKFTENNVIATSNFVIIRAKEDIINPEYLAIYLNTEQTKKQLHKLIEGSVLQTIRIPSLKQIKIKLPKNKQQEQEYIKLINTLAEKRQLRQEQVQLEDEIIEYYLNKI